MFTCWTSSLPSNTKTFLKMSFPAICLFLILMDGAYGSGLGRCPKYPLMENFDFSKLVGDWYGIKKSYKIMEYLPACVLLRFKTQELYKFNLLMIIIDKKTRYSSIYMGNVVQESTSFVNFQVDNNYGGQYHVLDTDYENFAILWSCNSWGPFYYFDQIWVIGRNYEFSAEVTEQINGILNKLGLDPNRLVLSNSLCYVY